MSGDANVRTPPGDRGTAESAPLFVKAGGAIDFAEGADHGRDGSIDLGAARVQQHPIVDAEASATAAALVTFPLSSGPSEESAAAVRLHSGAPCPAGELPMNSPAPASIATPTTGQPCRSTTPLLSAVVNSNLASLSDTLTSATEATRARLEAAAAAHITAEREKTEQAARVVIDGVRSDARAAVAAADVRASRASHRAEAAAALAATRADWTAAVVAARVIFRRWRDHATRRVRFSKLCQVVAATTARGNLRAVFSAWRSVARSDGRRRLAEISKRKSEARLNQRLAQAEQENGVLRDEISRLRAALAQSAASYAAYGEQVQDLLARTAREAALTNEATLSGTASGTTGTNVAGGHSAIASGYGPGSVLSPGGRSALGHARVSPSSRPASGLRAAYGQTLGAGRRTAGSPTAANAPVRVSVVDAGSGDGRATCPIRTRTNELAMASAIPNNHTEPDHRETSAQLLPTRDADADVSLPLDLASSTSHGIVAAAAARRRALSTVAARAAEQRQLGAGGVGAGTTRGASAGSRVMFVDVDANVSRISRASSARSVSSRSCSSRRPTPTADQAPILSDRGDGRAQSISGIAFRGVAAGTGHQIDVDPSLDDDSTCAAAAATNCSRNHALRQPGQRPFAENRANAAVRTGVIASHAPDALPEGARLWLGTKDLPAPVPAAAEPICRPRTASTVAPAGSRGMVTSRSGPRTTPSAGATRNAGVARPASSAGNRNAAAAPSARASATTTACIRGASDVGAFTTYGRGGGGGFSYAGSVHHGMHRDPVVRGASIQLNAAHPLLRQ